MNRTTPSKEKQLSHQTYILWASVCLIATVAQSTRGDAPSANVPPRSRAVVLDGRLSPQEWDDAAVVHIVAADDRTGPASGPVITTCRLKYDEQALWVGWLCRERVDGYPRAYPREPMDDLTQDDAVQVVLGVADEHEIVREVLNMGGYRGAMGTEAARADHYYQFTTSAVNAQSRTYNESLLRRPVFESRTAVVEGGWSAEMRIPWSSCGLDRIVGRTVYANLFRFRPPGRSAWHLPGFGGYRPMPFGQVTFLPRDRADQRTVEREPTPTPRQDASQLTEAAISYHPLSGAVVATIRHDGRSEGAVATLEVEGLGRKKRVLSRQPQQRMIFEIEPGSQPARQASLRIVSRGGELLYQTQRGLQAVTAPPWLGTDAGIEYLDREIPRPWTRPVVRGRTVQLVDKTLRFGPLGLFDSITDSAGELLAGSTTVQVEVDGESLRFEPESSSVRAEGTAVRVEAVAKSAMCRIESRSRVDYDGFTVVKLRLLGGDPERISRLAVRIPLRAEHARFAHRVLVQNVRPLTGFGHEAPAGPLWVGSEGKGLSFSFDTPVFRSRNRRTQMRVIKGDEDRTWMELNFVDGPGQVTQEGHVFRFFLHPTPTKPASLEKVRPRVAWQWERWSDWQGYPDLAKMDGLKQWSEGLHAEDRIALLYTCQGMAEDAPGFQAHKDDLMAWPAWAHYRRSYNPGRGVPCYHVCKRGPEGDLQLWAFEKLAREGGIDGTVSDGLSLPWNCDNPGHAHGCGRPVTVAWDEDARSRIVETRSFLKRLRGIFNDTGRPFYLSAHCGGGLDINTLSFFDSYMEGEQLSRYRPGYMIPRHIYAIGYNGYPWGFRTEFWEKTWRRNTRGWNWSLTYALLHDNEVHDGFIAHDIYRGFDDDATTKYYPYWRPGPHVRLKADRSLASYYLKDDQALVIVSNLSYEDDPIELDLSRLLPDRPINVTEMLTDRAAALEDRRFRTVLKGYHCLALKVQAGTAAPERDGTPSPTPPSPAPFTLEGHDSKLWRTNADDPSVTADESADLGEGLTGLNLTSKLYRAFATARLKPYRLGRNGTLALRVRIEKRFRLAIGPMELHHYTRWKMIGPLAGWNQGTVYHVPVSPDSTYLLVLTLRDGRVDAVLGDRLLVRDMAFDLPAAGNELVIRTWAGNHVAFALEKLSTEPRQLYQKGVAHPVR